MVLCSSLLPLSRVVHLLILDLLNEATIHTSGNSQAYTNVARRKSGEQLHVV